MLPTKRICVTPPTLAGAAFPRFVALRAAQLEAALPEPGVQGGGVVAMKGAGEFLCWRAGLLGRTRALCRIWPPFRGPCVTQGPLHVGLLLRAADPGLSAASSSTCHAAHPPPATPCTHPAARNAAAKAASIQSVKRRKQKGRGEHACALAHQQHASQHPHVPSTTTHTSKGQCQLSSSTLMADASVTALSAL